MVETRAFARQALTELQGAFDQIDSGAVDLVASEMLAARRIVCHGLGREGLMIRALCMRLMHLGLDAHMAGDVTTPPIGPGDLFLTSSGPGELLMIHSMIQLAHNSGARVLVLTAQPGRADPRAADVAVTIPAQTMANDRDSQSMFAMGAAYEISLLIFLDLAAIRIRELSGQTVEAMRARHYNLE